MRVRRVSCCRYPEALALISKALDVAQLEHVSLGVSSGRQQMREAIKKFTENPDVSSAARALVAWSSFRVYAL